jgi:hypothetical protein
MQLGYIFSFSEKVRHLPERFGFVIHVQTGDDHPDPADRKLVADFRELIVKELGFVYPDHIDFAGHQEDGCGSLDRG